MAGAVDVEGADDAATAGVFGGNELDIPFTVGVGVGVAAALVLLPELWASRAAGSKFDPILDNRLGLIGAAVELFVDVITAAGANDASELG